jgi:hypothetical protein
MKKQNRRSANLDVQCTVKVVVAPEISEYSQKGNCSTAAVQQLYSMQNKGADERQNPFRLTLTVASRSHSYLLKSMIDCVLDDLGSARLP